MAKVKVKQTRKDKERKGSAPPPVSKYAAKKIAEAAGSKLETK